jgi:hypothetical protein
MRPLVSPEAILAEVKTRRPRFILLTEYNLPVKGLADWLHEKYTHRENFLRWKLFERNN